MRFSASYFLMIILLYSVTANAEINYDYAQLDMLVDGEFEMARLDPDDYSGFGMEASALFSPRVFGFASAASRTVDFVDRDVSSNTFSAGIGIRHGFDMRGQAALDIYGALSHERYGLLDTAGNGGFGIGGGLRWMPLADLEVAAGVRHVNYGKHDLSASQTFDLDGVRYNLRFLFDITEQAAVAMDYRAGDLEADPEDDPAFDVDENEIRLGARWYY